MRALNNNAIKIDGSRLIAAAGRRSRRRLYRFGLALAVALPATAIAVEPTTRRTDFLPFGTESFHIPPAPFRIDVSAHAIELLADAIHTQAGPNRSLYITALGTCGPDALPALRPLLNDVDPTIRADAVRAIGVIGRAASAGDIRPLLVDADVIVRREAALALPKLNDAADITPAFGDVDGRVRAAAYGGAATHEQADALANRLLTIDPAEQSAAIDAIGRAGSASNAANILVFAYSADLAVRIAVIQALGKVHARAGKDAVVAALHDPFAPVRREALLALPAIDEDFEMGIAVTALSDADGTVREAAATLIANRPTTLSIESLTRQLGDEYEPAHLAARKALEAMGDSVSDVGGKLLDDTRSSAKIDGLCILGQSDRPIRINRRVELLDDPDYAVAAAAARSLLKVHTASTHVEHSLLNIVRRVQSLQNPLPKQWDAEQAAIELAVESGCEGIVDLTKRQIPVVPMQVNADERVRRTAIWAIGVLEQPHSDASELIDRTVFGGEGSGGDAFEWAKAKINMHDKGAVARLSSWRTDPSINADEASRWMAHLALDRLTGLTTPYTPGTHLVKPIIAVGSLD